MTTIPFGHLLKQLRAANGLTQEALAERAGYSAIYIRKLEHGDRTPLAAAVQVLADALDLDAQERTAFEMAAKNKMRSQRNVLHWHNHLHHPQYPLVGRSAAMASITACLDDLSPPLLLLAGEPGIGKTRLLQEAMAHARAQNYHVLAGVCYRQSIPGSYAPFPELLLDVLRACPLLERQKLLEGCSWLTRLIPDIPAAWLAAPTWQLPYEQERRLQFTAVANVLTRLTATHRLLLVVDDLQWANVDTLDLLAALVRSVPSLHLMGSYRDTEVALSELLPLLIADLIREGRLRREQITALSEDEAQSLLRHLRPESIADPYMPFATHLLRRSAGVPYYLVSWAQSVELATTMVTEIPQTVAENIQQRLAVLPEDALRWVEVVAIAGQDADRDLLLAIGQTLGNSQWEVIAHLEHLCQSHVLAEADRHHYGVSHELIRDIVIGTMSGGRRALLHQHIAFLLEQREANHWLPSIASHYYEAGAWEQAATYLERLGDQAWARYAAAEAERAYRLWLETLQQLHREAAEAHARVKLAEVIGRQGRFAEACQLLDVACASFHAQHELAHAAKATAKRAVLSAEIGRQREGLALLTPWFAPALFTQLSVADQGYLLMMRTNLLWCCGDYVTGLEVANEMLALAQRVQDPALLCRATWHQGRQLMMRGDVKTAIDYFTAALPQIENTPDLNIIIYLHDSLQYACSLQGQRAAADTHLDKALAIAQQMNNDLMRASLFTTRGMSAFERGNWSAAQQDYAAALPTYRQLGMPWGSAYPLFALGYLYVTQGEPEAGWALLREAVDLAQLYEMHDAMISIQGIFAENDLLTGHPELVIERLGSLWQRYGQHDLDMLTNLPILAHAYIAAGKDAQAKEIVTVLATVSQEQGLRQLIAESLTLQAMLLARAGQWQEAEATFAAAFAELQIVPYPYTEAKAYYFAGQVYHDGGREAQAQLMFVAAMDRFRQLGEHWYRLQLASHFDVISND
jgi:transcriptional regulator with XRE-family HTH domain/tetratricopeptide (TPR) repeat protein